MSLHTRLTRLPNPFARFRKRFTRYLSIVCCTGGIGFVVALVLLHHGVPALASLILSVLVSGLLGYGALELWGFPHRLGAFSWRRLAASSLVGALAFLGRYGVLEAGLRLFAGLAPFDKFISLALAYLASFTIGYLLRSRVVFHKSASVRLERPRECPIACASEAEDSFS